jgi:hypothetical protein
MDENAERIMTEHNLPVPDDAPWLNLNPEEVEELRKSKIQLTAQATQKLRKLKAKQQTQELLNAAHRVSDGGVSLGKLIRDGHQDPMVARVRFEYAALLRELINQCGYTKDELLVVNIRDIIGIIEVLEEMK